MKTLWVSKKIKYDGAQLRHLFGYLDHGLLGDSIVAFRGPCEISFEYMVDGEDLRAEADIVGSDMVHFIVEKFDSTLLAAVALQRLLAGLVLEELRCSVKDPMSIIREGDDIYLLKGKKKFKFSISIATQTVVSSLIHFAINVSNKGTPVPTASLEDIHIDPKKFAQQILKVFSQEVTGVVEATQKVFVR